MLTEIRKKFAEAAGSGKAPHASLPSKSRPLSASSDSSMGRAAPFNPSLPRLVGNFSGSRSAGFAVHEVGKLETVAH